MEHSAAVDSHSVPNKLRFDLSANQINDLSKQIIKESKETLDELAKQNKPCWETILKIADEEAIFEVQCSNCGFPSQMSTDKSVRDASTEARKVLDAYQIEKTFREDIYLIVKKYATTHNSQSFSAEDNRYITKLLEIYDRNGLGLPLDKRDKLKSIKKEISELSIQFQQNLNEDTTFLLFAKEQLQGLSDNFIDGLEKVEEKYKVTLQYPHLFPVLKQCSVPETRKLLNISQETQCLDKNIPILEKVLLLRQEEAELLNFKSHAEYILAIRMAKSPEKVFSFLNDLNDKLTSGLNDDLNKFLELKKKECSELGLPFDGKVNPWDWRYYYNMVIEKEYQVEEDKISEYFPVEHVTQAMLGIYEEVLALKFVKTEKPNTWHEDVQQYSVYNAKDSSFVGHFYLDLYPREGKYGHAAEFDIQKGCTINGAKQYPASAMLANFTKPLKDKPSLLKHDEVVTYFHEFGHVMHELMSTAKFHLFSGTNVQRDFVETPSQMLENWCYDAAVLKRLSKHYQTGESLTEVLRNQLVKAKKACAATLYKRQLFFGYFDMAVHTAKGHVNTQQVWSELRKKITGIEAPEKTNGAANFGHLLGGYSAGYYGYLWSEVFSADLFKEFEKVGVLNPDMGLKYREKILAPAGTKDAMDLLVDFLGREPQQEAFLIHIGLKN